MGIILRSVKKTLAGVSLLALTAAVAATALGAYLFERSLPSYSGQEKLPGLAQPVRIYRDTYGIPHIFAASDNDAAFALGYSHASERLFQMEMQRRAGQGRLSELLGADMVGIDKYIRTLGLYNLAQSSFEALSPAAQDVFRAYAAGVNAWLATHPDNLPPEFVLLRDEPEIWQPADSMVWAKLMALQLSQNYCLEMLRAELAARLGTEKTGWLFPLPPPGSPVTTQPVAASAAAASADTRLGQLLGLDHAASNEWVIGGSRSATGKPILANDPHLGLEAPILWYLARIVTPAGSVKGATVPGLPLVLLGQNDHLAWGFTTTDSDVQDLFVETLDPANPDRYLTPDGSEPFATRHETIRVKDGADIDLTVRATRHGPVLSNTDAKMAALAGPGKVMALAFTGLGDKDTTPEALLRIDHARNAIELLDALKLYQSPPQNIVYADDSGAFGFINPGLVPIRKQGDGLMPADGASGAYDWTGVVPFERLPQTANPAAGYIFNANNAVVGPDPADFFGLDWEETYRARRLQQFFNQAAPFTVAQSQAMQADHLSLAAHDLLPLLLAAPPAGDRARQALDMLRGWDGVMDKDRPEPALFEAWLYEFHRHMLVEKTGNDLDAKGPFAATTLYSLVTQHAQDWCAASDPDCRQVMAQSFKDALDLMTARQGVDMPGWRWGRENIATLHHKFYSHLPLFDKISDLSVASSGDFYTLDRGGGFDHDPQHPFARTHGGGYRGVYDLADPDASLFMIATGESGHIFSPHYGDLVKMWNDVKGITLSGSEDRFRQRGAPELDLVPQ